MDRCQPAIVIHRNHWAYSNCLLGDFRFSHYLALISGVKLKILGVPLTPWDLVVAGEASDMVKYVSNILTLNVLSVILLFLVGSYFILYRTTMFIKKVALKERGILAGIGLVMFLAVYTDLPLPVQKWFGIEAAVWNQVQNTKTNGYALATVLNTKAMLTEKREGYDDKAVEAIVSASPKPIKAGDPSNPIKPNVIVVLSEAFWDPTIIPGVNSVMIRFLSSINCRRQEQAVRCFHRNMAGEQPMSNSRY